MMNYNDRNKDRGKNPDNNPGDSPSDNPGNRPSDFDKDTITTAACQATAGRYCYYNYITPKQNIANFKQAFSEGGGEAKESINMTYDEASDKADC